MFEIIVFWVLLWALRRFTSVGKPPLQAAAPRSEVWDTVSQIGPRLDSRPVAANDNSTYEIEMARIRTKLRALGYADE
jgi:hypothetical protein